MITRAKDIKRTNIEGLHGGTGVMYHRHFLSPEDSHGMGRLFSHVSLNHKGDSIPWHTHNGDSELFYFLSGKARVQDADKESYILEPGDVILCKDGDGHSIENVGDEPLEYIAIILYTEQQN